MPKVSVIIPTYNRSQLIAEAVNSVLNQTEGDLEVIVVDDGSTDDTHAVIEAIKDVRIKYFYKPNGGPASARNLGLAKATGEYIAFLDSDDYWPEDYLERMIKSLAENPQYGAVYSDITVVYPDGKEIKNCKKSTEKSGLITSHLFKNSFIWTFAAVFKSSLWEDFYFDEALNKTSEDSDIFLRLSARTKFLFVSEVEAYHRISGDSISSETGITCDRLLSLERFYFQLGGKEVVPRNEAFKKLSHACRRIALDCCKKGKKAAALKLYGRAIKYRPFDVRLYFGFVGAALLNKDGDPEPNWQMPEPLGEPIGTNRFLREQIPL